MTSLHHFLRSADIASPGWELVGQTSQTWRDSSTSTAISLTGLTGGIASAPAEGDVVVVLYEHDSSFTNTLGISTSGYSTATANGIDTRNFLGLVGVKKMGATPDTDVTVTASTGNAGESRIVLVEVWRGGDPSTVLDASIVTASGGNTGQPNPGAISPLTPGALILVLGGCAGAYETEPSAFTSGDLTDIFQLAISTPSGSYLYGNRAAIGHHTWTSGAFDPAQWGGGTTSTTASWAAFTIALRPA